MTKPNIVTIDMFSRYPNYVQIIKVLLQLTIMNVLRNHRDTYKLPIGYNITFMF